MPALNRVNDLFRNILTRSYIYTLQQSNLDYMYPCVIINMCTSMLFKEEQTEIGTRLPHKAL